VILSSHLVATYFFDPDILPKTGESALFRS